MVRIIHCCCKRLSLKIEGEPILNAICSCDDCKRRTGSAFGWSTYFSDDQILEIYGTPNIYDVNITPPQQRYFCSNCGSTLFWKSDSYKNMTGVAGGAFTDNPISVPKASYRDNHRYHWINLSAELEPHD